MENSPLILIGAARSGTKFLRDVISTDPSYSKVPYDVNYVWRMGSENLNHDEIDPSSVSKSKKRKIKTTLSRLGRLKVGSDKQLVEKTVGNTLRVPFVDSVFPKAKYLHIVRDGRAVIESSYRLWQAPPDKSNLFRKLIDLPISQYNYLFWFTSNYVTGKLKGRSGGAVWGPRYDGILEDIESLDLFDVVTKQWKICVEKATEDLEKIESERVFTIHYEDLSNENKLKELVIFLKCTEPEKIVKLFSDKFDDSNLAKWQTSLTPEKISLIEKDAGVILKRYEYLK